MKQSELKLMLVGGTLARVIVSRLQPDVNLWSVSVAYNPGSHHAEIYGEILTNNDKTEKTYTSLDRATDALRKLGYKGMIEVVG